MRGYVTWPRACGGVFFGGTLIFGWFWIGHLGAIGAGWQPIVDIAGPLLMAGGR